MPAADEVSAARVLLTTRSPWSRCAPGFPHLRKGCKAGLRDGNPACKVRPCAIEKGVSTCAGCEEFACETIQKQMDAIKPIAEKHRDSMPVDDIRRYIAPYESEGRLRNLRSE